MGGRDPCVTADLLCLLWGAIVLHVDRSPLVVADRPLILLVLSIQEICLLVFVHLLDRGVQAEDVRVLVVLGPFVEAFQRRFEWFDVFFIHLTILEGCWEALSLWFLIA